MPYFFDILLVAVIAIFSIKHYKQGFAKTVLKFAKFFVSVILAILLGKLAAELIRASQILDGLPAPIGSALSGIIGYVLAFAISFAVLTLVIDLLCSVKIPVLHKLNELMGLALGLVIGIFCASILSTVVYTCLEVVSAIKGDALIMNVYNDSLIFKFIYDLRIFEFIRELA